MPRKLVVVVVHIALLTGLIIAVNLILHLGIVRDLGVLVAQLRIGYFLKWTSSGGEASSAGEARKHTSHRLIFWVGGR